MGFLDRCWAVGGLLALLLLAGCSSATQGPTISAGVDDDPVAKWAGRGRGLDGRPDDAEKPVVFAITAPAADAVLESNAVEVTFTLGNYTLAKHEDGTGNHVHFILDNEPYVPWYDATKPYVLKDVPEGTHVLRAFASRPWHESWKNTEAFGAVVFHVKAKSSGTPVFDPVAPLLTYSRPKGTYKGADIEKVLLDFWVGNCRLGVGDYQVRYTVDGGAPQLLSDWRPVWLAGLGKGAHTILLELVDGDGRLVTGNAWNRTERTVTLE